MDTGIQWISGAESAWLTRQAHGRKLIVEIGSHLGWSTQALARAGGQVVAVDDWRGPRDTPDFAGRDYYPEFLNNMVAAGVAERVRPLRMDHAEFAEKVRSGLYAKAEMVFFDGSHEYVDVRRDISPWLNVPGKRLLCGHDYNWPGVLNAVDELLPNAYAIPATSLWAWGDGLDRRSGFLLSADDNFWQW